MKKPQNPQQSSVVELPFKGSSLILNDMRAMAAQMAVLTERIDVLVLQSKQNTERLNEIAMRTEFLKGSIFAAGVIIAALVGFASYVLKIIF